MRVREREEREGERRREKGRRRRWRRLNVKDEPEMQFIDEFAF
jgi:hypothetical protein